LEEGQRRYAFHNSGLVKVDSIFDPYRPYSKSAKFPLIRLLLTSHPSICAQTTRVLRRFCSQIFLPEVQLWTSANNRLVNLVVIHLLRFVPSEWTGAEPVWVASGNLISHRELAEGLGVSPAVISNWRVKLRKLGLLGWLVTPGKGRALWVAGVNRVFSDGDNSASQQAANPAAALPAGLAAEVWRAIQQRSIALTGKLIEDLTPIEGTQLARVLAQGSEIVDETRRE
jgi:hypothetical protein